MVRRPQHVVEAEPQPGAWMPSTYPLSRNTCGSFSVIQCVTRSESASATTRVYSANQSALSQLSQPPR